ncbi:MULTISPECIES: ThiF family adenylyltransferase [unclassified Colwellia]|jgi:molybdopterin/thiamine biosynthesis adenylyltransferase|uniref:HesA/MoeB/ThiF family protein n=1 Tax=unclassified Colwellia TaxID=196834 RepID=UPI0015F4C2AD|nr:MULTISPECIES: ThiF family adenylyltransferase [unclassified Colwellia]MBA6379691.1 ThiF family adenylyltransferase [Colwellia sp. BRX10-7]MBA6388494.1 ThiF family adenylyltransferase [Colwellia sp. BRX10-2]MBA6402992.1 ThiF family adenylyltransferase [Colwellia sp. BRX10-5]MBA6406309.1 ThiF family adenylyltransferase [Colwellia sp. BRX10-1]
MKAERYQRHSLIDWFPEDKIKAAKIGIVGCGAVGNEVAKNLALLGVGNLDLYDFDTIEVHNLTRSVLFRESDVGKSKAEVAASKIIELDSNVNVNAFDGDFWDLMTLPMVESYDCIICCVDNFEARIRLNQLCLIAKTNLINTGIDSKFCQIELFPFQSGNHVACFECNLPNSAYERMQQRYSCGWLKKISFIEKKIPTTIITSSLTGSIAASKALNLLKGELPSDSVRVLVDSFTGNSTISTIQQSCECPACASFNDFIHIVKASPEVNGSLNYKLDVLDDQVTTSEPILVSLRCHNCDPELKEEVIIFKKSSDFDSTISVCDKCGEDGVEVNINDTFTLSELKNKFSDYFFPCKFVHYKFENQSIIIEMEQ